MTIAAIVILSTWGAALVARACEGDPKPFRWDWASTYFSLAATVAVFVLIGLVFAR